MLVKKELDINSDFIKKIISTESHDQFEITLLFAKEKYLFLTRVLEMKISCCDIEFSFKKDKENFIISFRKKEDIQDNINYLKSLLEDYDRNHQIINFIDELENIHETHPSSTRTGYQKLTNNDEPSSRLTCPNPFKKWRPAIFLK